VRILFVDATRQFGELLVNRLARSRYNAPDGSAFEVEITTDYGQARASLTGSDRYDAAIVEISTAAAAGGVALQLVADLKTTPVIPIVLTARPSFEECVICMRAGAWDYIAKTRPIDELVQRLLDSFKENAARPDVDRDALFVETHFASLHNEHAGNWIAVGNGVLVAAAPTYDELLNKVEKSAAARPKFWRMPPPSGNGS
jgi:DNA-binding response OmpR family regulator